MARALVVDVEAVTARAIEVDSKRLGKPLLLPFDEVERRVPFTVSTVGVPTLLKAAVYSPVRVSDNRGRVCWVYVRRR